MGGRPLLVADAPDGDLACTPDERLAARIGAAPPCDAAAERELFRRFAPRVRLFALHHLRNDAEIGDLVQEALLVTIEALRRRRVSSPERLGAYVLGVCRRLVAERRRADVRERDRIALAHSAIEDEPPGPELDRDRLSACLRGLAERERTVVVLTFFAERDSAEIAVELGLSPGNVRVIRHRALGRLRGCMGLDDDGEGGA